MNKVFCDSNDNKNGECGNHTNVDSINKNSSDKSDTEIDCTKYVYSFELRRMVPIYVANKNKISSSSNINKTNDMIDCEEGANRTETTNGAHNIRNRQDTVRTAKSCAQDALLQALGVSLDYAKQCNVENKETVFTKRQRANNDNDLTLKNSKKHRKGNKEQSKKVDIAITNNANEKCIDSSADFNQKKASNLTASPPLSSSLPQSSEQNTKASSKLSDGDKTTRRAEQNKNDSNNLTLAPTIIERKEKSKKTHYRPGKRERRLLRQNTSNTNKEE